MKMTKELHLKLVEAWWDGELEFLYAEGGWRPANRCPHNESDTARYRIRPKPRLRPWKPEEVPVGAELRSVANRELRCLIVASGKEVLTVVGNTIQHFTFERAFEGGEHSTDGGKTWKPCGVEEAP